MLFANKGSRTDCLRHLEATPEATKPFDVVIEIHMMACRYGYIPSELADNDSDH